MAEDGGEEGEQADEEEGPLVQVGVDQVVHVDSALIHLMRLKQKRFYVYKCVLLMLNGLRHRSRPVAKESCPCKWTVQLENPVERVDSIS